MSKAFTDVVLSKTLNSYCRNATNKEGDTFVGIKSEIKGDKHEISVNFPIGYNISKKEENLRDDIIDLISVLSAYNDKQSRVSQISSNQVLKTVRFPVQAYFRVMRYYLDYDYYMENEEVYVQGTSGPVNMKQTIKRVTPIVQKTGFVYPNLMVRKNSDTDKHIITEINKFCVYESFMKLGWIYKQRLPQPANVRNPNLKMYQTILRQKLEKTNEDSLKQLFQSMLAIIEFRNSADDPEEFYFGTNNFEYVWEKLIDETYGVSNKGYYFPKTNWKLRVGDRDNAALEPDTIMITDESIAVLDAKYYKYGVTGRVSDLPRSTSINKQITYAEYIAENSKFIKDRKNNKQMLNAFLLPFNLYDNRLGGNENYYSIGEAVADWKQADKDYERVQGILIDVKKLMANSTKPNRQEIKRLSDAIKDSLIRNKKMQKSGN